LCGAQAVPFLFSFSFRRPRKRFMTALSRMFGSTVGRKYLVAVTGILLVLFLIGHLVGNLLLYAGRDAMNSYAQGLKNLGAGLWVIRAGLLAVFVVHISLAISLNLASKKARGVAYASPLRSWSTRPTSASSSHRRRHRPRRRVGRRHARRARLQRRGVHVPRQPRRAHSIAAQGGINAAKNYQNDGDSVYRLFYDTIKGGDFRSARPTSTASPRSRSTSSTSASPRACPSPASTAACSPTARSAARRSAAPSTPAARPASSCCSAPTRLLSRQIGLGNVKMHNRMEMLDVVNVDGRCARHRHRDLMTGEIESHSAHAVVLATGGYGNVFYLSTNAMACNVTGAWRAHKRGAASPTRATRRSTPPASRSRRLPVEAHADVGVAAQRRPDLGAEEARRHRPPTRSPRTSATTTSSASTRASATSPARRRVARGQGGRATPAAASARSRTASTSTSPTRSAAWARRDP
jgi:hypothetical protein